jgi:programmed cell death protein 5
MSELDEIRKRKFAALQKQQATAQAEEQKLVQQVAQLEAAVKPLLTREALVRYGTIKAAYPEKAIQVLVVVAQLAQAGRLTSVDDAMLKKLLAQLTPKQRETQIRGMYHGKK